jgi:hypothetical protein
LSYAAAEEVAQITNASSNVEERRFQRRAKALISVRASAPVVEFLVRQEFFRNLFIRAVNSQKQIAL